MRSPIPALAAPLALMLALVLALTTACGADKGPETTPAGREASAGTDALEAGAAALQGQAPFRGFDVYLVGFHPMKDDPSHQMEAHHFCRQVNEDLAQCALFDGNTAEANLNGVEYIISEKLFQTLPAAERGFWHPHNYEILSGQLVGPGLPEAAEKELMRRKMNSYGKTWHVWSTSQGDRLPMGEAMLAWSFNRDGEARPELLQRRRQQMGIDDGAKRRERQDLVPLARLQSGVDALKGRFPGATPIPGVADAGAAPGPAAPPR